LPSVQPFKIANKKIMEEGLSIQSRQFKHHNSDNNNTVANTTILVDVYCTNGEEEINKAPK
jgi:hypothetical protein